MTAGDGEHQKDEDRHPCSLASNRPSGKRIALCSSRARNLRHRPRPLGACAQAARGPRATRLSGGRDAHRGAVRRPGAAPAPFRDHLHARSADRARERGGRATDASWDDLFTQVLLERIEPALGIDRPTYLTEYPASQAALARLKPSDPRVAERFELYAGGLELANGFSELCDSREQRERLREEQELRRRLARDVFPLDEKFLSALDRIGEAGGVAVGFDRLLMLLTGAETIADVLLFPAVEEYPVARRAR